MVAGAGDAGSEMVGEDVRQTETCESSEAQVSLDRATFDAEAEIQVREDLTVQASEELEQEVRDAVEAVLDTAAADPAQITFSPDDVQVDGVGEGGMVIGAAPVETDSDSAEAAVDEEEEAPPPEAVQGAMDMLNTLDETQDVIAGQLDQRQVIQPGSEVDSGQDTQEEPSTSPGAQETERDFEQERTTLGDRAEAMTAQDEGKDGSDSLRTDTPSLGSQTEAVPPPETDASLISMPATPGSGLPVDGSGSGTLPESELPEDDEPSSVDEFLATERVRQGDALGSPVESIEGEDQADAPTVVGRGASSETGQAAASEELELEQDENDLLGSMREPQREHADGSSDRSSFERPPTSDGQRDASDSQVESIEGEYQADATNEVELVINQGADSDSDELGISDILSDMSEFSLTSIFLKLNIQDPRSEPPPEFDRSASLDAVTATEALIENYEETLEVLEADLRQLWELLEEYQARPEGSQSSDVFTFHMPVRSADGTYQLIGIPVALSSATIQTWIPVLQTAIIQIQTQLAAID